MMSRMTSSSKHPVVPSRSFMYDSLSISLSLSLGIVNVSFKASMYNHHTCLKRKNKKLMKAIIFFFLIILNFMNTTTLEWLCLTNNGGKFTLSLMNSYLTILNRKISILIKYQIIKVHKLKVLSFFQKACRNSQPLGRNKYFIVLQLLCFFLIFRKHYNMF